MIATMDGSPESSFWESATRPPVLLLVSGLFLAVLYVYYKIAYEPYQLFKLLGVKGPTPRVFLGNTVLFKTMGEEKMFEHLYHTYGSISGFYLGTKPYLVAADPHILEDIMTKAVDCFTDVEVDEHFTHTRTHRLPYSLLPASRKEWQKMCSMFGSTFIPSKMKMLVPLLQESHKTLLRVLRDAIADPEKSVDIWRLYCSTTVEMLCSLIGEKVQNQAGEASKLSRSIQSFFAHHQERSKRDILFNCIIRKCPFMKRILKYFSRRVRAQTNFEEIVKAVTELLQAHHRKQPQQTQESMKKDFLHMLIEASNSAKSAKKNISHAQVVSFCVIFLLTCYDTITNTLAYTSYLLTLYPSVQAKLCSEIDSYYKKTPAASIYDVSEQIEYLDMVILESLRMYSPTSKIYRTCVRACTLRGLSIFPGIRVVIPIDLIRHLPEHWEEPEAFKPERFATKEKEISPSKFLLTFGISESPQSCMGMKFALTAVKILLIEILRNYKFGRAPDTEVPLETTTMRRPANGIHVKIRRYIRYTQSVIQRKH